jgi:hypothetical protein
MRSAQPPIVALVVACFFGSASAQAQFAQQGPKLVGTGAIGNTQQGFSVSLSNDGSTAQDKPLPNGALESRTLGRHRRAYGLPVYPTKDFARIIA